MIRKFSTSFGLAVANIRSRFFHTFLSVLGIVIGVGALVAILSLIDGMEKYANEQIATTTTLNGIEIASQSSKVINNVRVKKDTVSTITYPDYVDMKAHITQPLRSYLRVGFAEEVFINKEASIGASIIFSDTTLQPGAKLIRGSSLDLTPGVELKMIVNRKFAELLGDTTGLFSKRLFVRGKEVTISGVVDERTDVPQCFLPITALSAEEQRAHASQILLEASAVTDVPLIKTSIGQWLKNKYPQHHTDFQVQTNEFRVAQAARGFLLFRVIMGLIVGISVIVGGIGVMNVLLISVTERTSEIGIRKAVGATRADILLQFLSESVTVSAFGCGVGLLFGILGTMVIIPIVNAITKVPFQAAFTVNTLIVISIVALAIGIIFGTYPALRASRLDPVEAIRRNE